MSKSFNSPTARLLQSSRLFSLPRPLPQPALETVSSTGQYRASDSATLPSPTWQAIATPASSHFRGDWGTKRPLPKRATKSSTPHIKLKAHDNFAHITDFESAADHTQTEAKWRQMGVPMVVRDKSDTYSDNKTAYSAYDDHIDNTDPEGALSRKRFHDKVPASSRTGTDSVQFQRWKFDGPWLAGMQEGEFDIYVQTQLESRRTEFRDFMIQRLVHKRIQDEERRLLDMGQRRPLSTSRRNAILQDITANYETEQKRLRDDHAVQHLASELTAAICEFLDLPGVRESAESANRMATAALSNIVKSLPSETGAPPSTHPGAGLSHLRSNAIMENHPFWGPQAYGSPVLARVVRPRTNAYGSELRAKLGVGGVVANDPQQSGYKDTRSRSQLDPEGMDPEQHYLQADRMTEQIEVDLPGGNKVWVHPESASVDDEGRIRFQVGRGDKQAIAVARGEVEEILQAKRAALSAPSPMPPPRGTAGNANYGFRLPDRKYAAPRSRVQGFDEELSRGPQQGRKDGESAALDRIKEMASWYPRK